MSTPNSTSAEPARARDFDNAELTRWLWVGFLGATVIMLLTGLGRVFYPDDIRPGNVALHLAAAVGSALLFAAWWSALAKRRGANPKRGLRKHVIFSAIGMALVAAHTTAEFFEAPMLLLLTLVALMIQGTWARTSGAAHLATTFGSKATLIAAPDDALRERLKRVLRGKQTLLLTLDATADEALFALEPRHWLRTPLQAWRYRRLVAQERALIGADAGFSVAQRLGRQLHQLLAWAFVFGLVVHIVLATWFAGYVADGREIYWWHLAAWDF